MDESEQYFAYLFSTWREEKEKDMIRTYGEVQDAVLRSWLERGGGEGGSREDTTGQCGGGGVRGKKVKKTRDPDEPKRPLSCLMLYQAEKKDEVKKELPSLGPKDLMKELGRRWAPLEKEEKEVYLARANQLFLVYQQNLASYKARKDAEVVNAD